MTNTNFEPSAILAELKARAEAATALEAAGEHPTELKLTAIELQPALFQPRGSKGTDPMHIEELRHAVRLHGKLAPVLVIQVGGSAVLVDGHHRLEAYREEGVTEVPVKFFGGTLEEAVLESGRANSEVKLNMSNQQKQDYAWRLVVMGGVSKKQIRESAQVSDGLVATMRRTLTTLGTRAAEFESWRMAKATGDGRRTDDMSHEEREQWVEAQAKAYAERMQREFTNKLSSNIEIGARALEIYFGRRMPELIQELKHHLPDTADVAADF
jgi:ParB-like chromosome segregation protein Spo0J